jgi:hypothetical protein
MNTAVQLRADGDDTPRCDLLHGAPSSTAPGKVGPVALFPSGEIVAYRIRRSRRTRVLVFRTLEVDDRLAATIPGVHPRVQLLFEVRSAAHARLVRGLFGYLVRSGHNPCGLPDAFYLRVGVALAGRLSAHKILRSLLEPRFPGPQGAIS